MAAPSVITSRQLLQGSATHHLLSTLLTQPQKKLVARLTTLLYKPSALGKRAPSISITIAHLHRQTRALMGATRPQLGVTPPQQGGPHQPTCRKVKLENPPQTLLAALGFLLVTWTMVCQLRDCVCILTVIW